MLECCQRACARELISLLACVCVCVPARARACVYVAAMHKELISLSPRCLIAWKYFLEKAEEILFSGN